MKQRFILYRRNNGKYYAEDTVTRKQSSLKTRDEAEALTLLHSKNEAFRQPVLNLQIARTYLSATDGNAAKRTWQTPMDEMTATKTGVTQIRYERAMRDAAFDSIRKLPILETHAEHFLKVLRNGTVCTNLYLRRIQNFALDMDWLPKPILPKKQWPKINFKEKRAITLEEHQTIIAREKNIERRLFYQLAWHLGAAQSDLANLKAEDVDWQERVISFFRKKTHRISRLHFGDQVEKILQDLPSSGPLFPYLSRVRAGDRATEFKQRCRGLQIEGVTLHSYRYAWAERAKTAGYPERFAMENLGQNSKAVHRAYSRKAPMQLPPLEERQWGGVCIDDKGVYHETLKDMAAHFHREKNLILLQVRPDDAPYDWKPAHTYNLLSDRKIPFTTYAKFVVDTATSLGQQGDKAFFKQQAQTHIALALEALYLCGWPVTLWNVHEILCDDECLDEVIDELSSKLVPGDRDEAIITHFMNRYRDQPPEQFGGVKETIGNYLNYFLTPDIAEIFCPLKSTFEFDEIDRGKIICLAMPQKFQAERRYINTFLKMLFYTHVMRRFDKPKMERADDNLLILWADEAQRFVTASEDGMSDYNSVDVLREANATLVAATQSSTSFIPPLSEDKARVLTLNLRNRMIFKAADETDAVQSADFLGRQQVVKRTWGYANGHYHRNYHHQDEHKIKPYQLRHLKKHQCVLVHCEKGFERVTLPPLEPDGTIPEWFPWWRRLL